MVAEIADFCPLVWSNVLKVLVFDISLLCAASPNGLSNGGLRPLTRAPSSAIVRVCGLLRPVVKELLVTKFEGNCGQLRQSTLSPHLKAPIWTLPRLCGSLVLDGFGAPLVEAASQPQWAQRNLGRHLGE